MRINTNLKYYKKKLMEKIAGLNNYDHALCSIIPFTVVLLISLLLSTGNAHQSQRHYSECF